MGFRFYPVNSSGIFFAKWFLVFSFTVCRKGANTWAFWWVKTRAKVLAKCVGTIFGKEIKSMPRQKKETESQSKVRRTLSPEAREAQMISYAVDLAEQQLRDGTASSQIITEYLKRGSRKTELELEKLRHENELLKAKTEAIQSAAKSEELYENALKAFTRYAGLGGEEV